MRSALITGSTSGIGLAVAQDFVRRGLNVMLNGFGSKEEIDAALASCRNLNSAVKVDYLPADLSRKDEAVALVKNSAAAFGGRLDVLVNNAGIQHVAPIDEFPDDKYEQIININLNAVFHTTKTAIPIMKQYKHGRIINIASVHGLVASANKSAYVAAKHGVIGLTKAVALETARTGITCNAVCPGWVLTPLVEKQIQARAAADGISYDDAMTALVSEKMPTAVPARLEEIANACWYFADELAAASTGTILTVDGAWCAQ